MENTHWLSLGEERRYMKHWTSLLLVSGAAWMDQGSTATRAVSLTPWRSFSRRSTYGDGG